MRHYEIVVIARSEQKERSEAMTQRHQKIIVDGGGGVHRFEDWGVRPLAYPINKQFNARYFLYNVECEQNTLNELKESLRFSESIIRYMVVRCDKAETEESPMLKRIRSEAEKAKEEEAAAASSPPSGRGRGRGERGERRTPRGAVETEAPAATATVETPAAEAETSAAVESETSAAVESETPATVESETSAATEAETSAVTESEAPAATESAIEESPSGEETASAADTAGEAKETKPDTDDSAPETPETPETPEGTEDEKTK